MTIDERQRIHDIVAEIGVPSMLNGSAVMVLHGMPRTPADIDVFVSTEDWFWLYHRPEWDLHTCDKNDRERRCDPPFLRREMYGIRVDVFFTWRIRGYGDIDINKEWRRAEFVDNLRCVKLESILEWKSDVLREKDEADAEMIHNHLKLAERM